VFSCLVSLFNAATNEIPRGGGGRGRGGKEEEKEIKN
jgi:hypothetical protein